MRFCFQGYTLSDLPKIQKYRAIRTLTVDLLGKTDRTDYYQNDSAYFKDPTCIFFFCIGLFH
ncbi:hypothetical protein V6Z11_D07G166900 [Gossypium hirsutum]